MSNIQLKITGMTCEHCVRAVARALEGVPGVDKVNVTLETGEAVVHGKVDTAALITAVEEEGYKAERG